MHDFERVGNIYKDMSNWFSKNDERKGLLATGGWMAYVVVTLLVPFIAANAISMGPTLSWQFDLGGFGPYIEAGGAASLFWHPDDNDMIGAIGGVMGAGFRFGKRFSVGTRVLWSPRDLQTDVERPTAGGILSTIVTMNIYGF